MPFGIFNKWGFNYLSNRNLPIVPKKYVAAKINFKATTIGCG